MDKADKQKLQREIADLKGQVRLTAGLRPNLLENHKRALEIKRLRRETSWRSSPWLQPTMLISLIFGLIAVGFGVGLKLEKLTNEREKLAHQLELQKTYDEQKKVEGDTKKLEKDKQELQSSVDQLRNDNKELERKKDEFKTERDQFEKEKAEQAALANQQARLQKCISDCATKYIVNPIGFKTCVETACEP